MEKNIFDEVKHLGIVKKRWGEFLTDEGKFFLPASPLSLWVIESEVSRITTGSNKPLPLADGEYLVFVDSIVVPGSRSDTPNAIFMLAESGETVLHVAKYHNGEIIQELGAVFVSHKKEYGFLNYFLMFDKDVSTGKVVLSEGGSQSMLSILEDIVKGRSLYSAEAVSSEGSSS